MTNTTLLLLFVVPSLMMFNNIISISSSSSPSSSPSSNKRKYIPTVRNVCSDDDDNNNVGGDTNSNCWGKILAPSFESTPYNEDYNYKSISYSLLQQEIYNNDFKQLMQRQSKFNKLWIADDDEDDEYFYA